MTMLLLSSISLCTPTASFNNQSWAAAVTCDKISLLQAGCSETSWGKGYRYHASAGGGKIFFAYSSAVFHSRKFTKSEPESALFNVDFVVDFPVDCGSDLLRGYQQ